MSAKKKSPLTQLTLNFGQRAPNSIECKECGLFYDLNDKEDSKLHKKIHNEREAALRYSINSESEKVVQEYPDGKCVVVEFGVDPKHLVRKALQVLEYVDHSLGIRQDENQQTIKSYDVSNSAKFYFFISAKKIVGFCLAEKIERAHRIKYLNSQSNAFVYDEVQAEKAECGISRIWVWPGLRRNKIASRLLDCVRLNFLYFCYIASNQIAFSDPTQLGQALAKSYFATDAFLVYTRS